MSDVLKRLQDNYKARYANPDIATAAINYAIEIPIAIAEINRLREAI